jgi:DNA (cytosine-5)-methyltransferase 1
LPGKVRADDTISQNRGTIRRNPARCRKDGAEGRPEIEAIEICAGAGGQALGLERAGFEHALAVELDLHACNTLRANRPAWKIAEGDAASPEVWNPGSYAGIGLLAGGVPCPPFTVAGKQLGAADERDLFAWAVELCGVLRPRALLLENVRGLSTGRFAAYRQHVLDRLRELGYIAQWRLLQASDFGVPQLRPRFVLVALRPQDAPWFSWPEAGPRPQTVGETLADLMGSRGWCGTAPWARRAAAIAPTIVGGSKKHGGADLGPTRARRAWAKLGVNGLGVADAPPSAADPPDLVPKLTCEMVARLQGWRDSWGWEFTGGKTARYRQIGNAFPPPVAQAVGASILRALCHDGEPHALVEHTEPVHDPVYMVLHAHGGFLSVDQIAAAVSLDRGEDLDPPAIERHISHLSRDFEVEIAQRAHGPAYRIRRFRAFLGQRGHARHEQFLKNRAKIS